MDNNQFNKFNPQGGNVSTKQLFSYIGLGCSVLGAVLTFIFSIVTCARGRATMNSRGTFTAPLKLSYAGVGVFIGVIFCIAGIVLIILSKEKDTNLNKLAMVGLIVAAAAIVYALLTTCVICAYNCSFNNYVESEMRSYSSWFK